MRKRGGGVKPNWERGFKRITWIISALGLIAMIIGLGVFIVNSTRQTSGLNDIKSKFLALSDKEHFLKILKDAQGISTENQIYERVRQNLQKKFPTGESLGAVAFGAGWFVFVWVIFFILRWIIRGFQSGG